ncbi:MAG: pyruvate kinase [Bacilli bacterium]
MRKTKIICTIGPACESVVMLKKLVENGLDCARLNFSHGNHEEHRIRIERIKQLRTDLNIALPILLDTKGPEIRLGTFQDGAVDVQAGQLFTFNINSKTIGTNNQVAISCPQLYEDISVGTTLLVDDGKVGFEVIELKDGMIGTKVINGGRLSNRKSVNVPNVSINLPYMSEQDQLDILFGISQDVDFIAASFARNEEDMKDLRTFLDKNGGERIKIFAKIENRQGINHVDDILKYVDGIMIARGDMGVEVPFKELPFIQKQIIKKCYRAGKHVITATQMLESMTKNPRPTRAEVSDVANAIYDGTTIIMLSGETAMGDYPVESVTAMAEIAESTEQAINYKKRFETNHLDLGVAVMSAIANAAVISANQVDAKAIIAVTRKGVTAKTIANYRPNSPIVAVTPDYKAFHQLRLAWNVFPLLFPTMEESIEEAFDSSVRVVFESKFVKKNDVVAITGGVKKTDLQTGILKIYKV